VIHYHDGGPPPRRAGAALEVLASMSVPLLDVERSCAHCGLGEFHPAFPGPLYGPLCRACEDLRLLTRPPPPSRRTGETPLPRRQHATGQGTRPRLQAHLVLIPVVLAFIAVAYAPWIIAWPVLALADAAIAGWAWRHITRSPR